MEQSLVEPVVKSKEDFLLVWISVEFVVPGFVDVSLENVCGLVLWKTFVCVASVQVIWEAIEVVVVIPWFLVHVSVLEAYFVKRSTLSVSMSQY